MTKLSEELRVARKWEKETTAFVHAADHTDATSISAGESTRRDKAKWYLLASMHKLFVEQPVGCSPS